MTSGNPSADYRPQGAQRFIFSGADYAPETGVATLRYRFDGHPELVEEISFPHAPWPPDASRQAAFNRALELLHLVAGTSYYKAGAPPGISVEGTAIGPATAEFLQELYVQGLAEFAHVNDIDLSHRIRFEPTAEQPPAAHELVLPSRALVAMGGGKDSLVGLRLLQHAGMEVLPVCVGGSTLIGDTVKAAGLPLLRIRRKLAPELSELNRNGALNGHVPVTAINSAILLCASILYGFSYIVFANERSADEATLQTPDGRSVNHQYSKSSAFENAFREVIANEISPQIEYFSVLRPFSEIGIVQRFARMREFHPMYSSCNRNFHLEGSRVVERWCRDCPKCRFAALSLALFMTPDEVTDIMGGQLLDDPSQVDGYRELCRLGKDKPFECVGEAGESLAAIKALSERPQWRAFKVIEQLAPLLDSKDIPSLKTLLQPYEINNFPPGWSQALYAAWADDEAV